MAADPRPAARDGAARPAGPRGHRLLPHTADLRLHAWAPTREECVAEAVRALVESFAETAQSTATGRRVADLTAASDEGVLLAALDEVVYLVDADGVVPTRVETRPLPGGVLLVLDVTDLGRAEIVGPAPKGVARSGLRFAGGPSGWSCRVTVDV